MVDLRVRLWCFTGLEWAVGYSAWTLLTQIWLNIWCSTSTLYQLVIGEVAIKSVLEKYPPCLSIDGYRNLFGGPRGQTLLALKFEMRVWVSIFFSVFVMIEGWPLNQHAIFKGGREEGRAWDWVLERYWVTYFCGTVGPLRVLQFCQFPLIA